MVRGLWLERPRKAGTSSGSLARSRAVVLSSAMENRTKLSRAFPSGRGFCCKISRVGASGEFPPSAFEAPASQWRKA